MNGCLGFPAKSSDSRSTQPATVKASAHQVDMAEEPWQTFPEVGFSMVQ